MPKIINIIPTQSFELIRDRITEILIDEINNQLVLTARPLEITYTVEGSGAIHHNDCPLINVSLERGDFNSKHAASMEGAYVFNIDCYTEAKETNSAQAETLATLNTQKLLGVCRTVLENPVYKTLGFNSPFISKVLCNSIVIADPIKQDASTVIMGRLTITINALEITEKMNASIISGYETEIRVSGGVVGFHYSKPE